MKAPVVFVLVFGFCLSAVIGLHAQQGQQDSSGFESIRVGTRIELTLKNHSTFTGEVVEKKPDRVKLNLAYEKLGVEGSMTFYKREVKKVVLLSLVPIDEVARIKAEREEAAKKAALPADATEAKTAESAEDKEKAAKEEEDAARAEKRKKNQEIINKFPASEWNEDKKEEIEAKTVTSRTPEELEFIENYDQVITAREDEANESGRDLLAKFPPPEWGQEKYDELKRTRFPAIEDIFMTDLEKEFVDSFGEWQKAYQEQEAEKARSAGTTPGEETPGAGSEGAASAEGSPTPPEEGAAPPSETTPPGE